MSQRIHDLERLLEEKFNRVEELEGEVVKANKDWRDYILEIEKLRHD